VSGTFNNGPDVDEDWEPSREDYAVLGRVNAEYEVDPNYVYGLDVDVDWEPTDEDYAVLNGPNSEYDVDPHHAQEQLFRDRAARSRPADHIVTAPVLQAQPLVSPSVVGGESPSTRPVIGRVSATERTPSSSEEFQFWMGPDDVVNPFDIVEAEHLRETTTFGLVTNIEHITDAASHLSNFVSMDFGDVYTEEQTPRTGVNIASVTVMANDSGRDEDQGVYMPVQNGSVCRFASHDGILRALGIDRIPVERRVPAGLISLSNGTNAPVYLDAAFLLGPESAHINITGISGLATKTSYAMFIIQSILQTVGASDVAVIMLNVKQDDLLHVHSSNPDLTNSDRAEWEQLNLLPEPFHRVSYLLPVAKGTSRANCHGNPPDPHELYAYSLRDVVGTSAQRGPGIESLLRTPDSSGTMASLVSEIEHNMHAGAWARVRDWHSLLEGEPLVKDGKSQKVGDIAPASVGKFRRVMRGAVLQSHTGIFVNQRSSGVRTPAEKVRAIRGGETLVIDIAQLRDHERALVFSDVITEVHRMYAEESRSAPGSKEASAEGGSTTDRLPSRMIIFVDELNKYAPPTRGELSAVTDYVLDIAARGRSLGVVLVSAEQFMSEVHNQVVGSCATKLVGRSDSAELAKDTYRGIVPNDLRAQVTRLGKGYMLLSHPVFRQPVRVKFPQPAYKLIGHSGGSTS
jgi:uncharacterized protein